MSSFLDVRAGKTALALIRDNGWDMNRVQVLAGAAGGPKWLSFYALDQLIFGELLQDRTEPLYLLGSSIGAWRFAAASASPAALERLQAEYIAQRYSARPGPQEVSAEGRRILGRPRRHAQGLRPPPNRMRSSGKKKYAGYCGIRVSG